MTNRRHKNGNWQLAPAGDDGTVPNDSVTHALLMDIRDELQALNRVFACWRFQGIPHTLERIDRRIQKRWRPLRPKKKGR